MVQGFADWGKENRGYFGRAVCSTIRLDFLEAERERLGHHHHAGPAAKRAVIHPAVVAVGKFTGVPELDVYQARFIGTAGDAAGQKWREKLGEQGDDVKAHG